MLENINAKTYSRVDMGGVKRVGFIANDIQANLPEECGNVLGNAVYNGNAILTLDYSRLTPFLWQIAKKQQELITDLSTRVQALENNNTSNNI